MNIPHFQSFKKFNHYSEYCQICGKGGNTYGFGRYDENFHTKNLCEKHYKIELRKEKIKKLCRKYL